MLSLLSSLFLSCGLLLGLCTAYTADWLEAFDEFTDPYNGRPPSPEHVPSHRTTRQCVNTPSTRACWQDGFSITDDFDKKWPNTGKVRHYDWEIRNLTLAPDGHERMVLTVNGQYPGPALYADWGDTLVVTVRNMLENNGTTIHWHGLRMYHKNHEDGVPGVTECPTPPGETRVYSFIATQYGTSWYHSHYMVQYGDGILGPIIINGPATANYDEDLGALPLTDWFHTPIAQLAYTAARTIGPPPTADNGLINGSMVSPNDARRGAYHRTAIQHGKRYRLRFINTAMNDEYMISLDSHDLYVISMDLVPIRPYWTHWLFIGIGQRYDVVFKANQTIGNYWFRAEVQTAVQCGINDNNGHIKSIFSYEGATAADPTSTNVKYDQTCADPPASSLKPFWNSFVPSGPFIEGRLDTAVQVGVSQENEVIVKWGVNLSAISVRWNRPTLQSVFEQNYSFTTEDNLIILPDQGRWYYFIIEEVDGAPVNINLPHPIHLHGHDFYVLGSGIGSFIDADRSTLNFNNPPRRDTAMLPTSGWLVIAFQTDNPGAWLCHCHIAWHSEVGFAVQFLESAADAFDLIKERRNSFDETCDKWNAYYPSNSYYHRNADDSGV